MPAAFPDFMDFIDFIISSSDGGLVFMSRSSSWGVPWNAIIGSGLFSTALKCSTKRVASSLSVEMMLPFLSLTGGGCFFYRLSTVPL